MHGLKLTSILLSICLLFCACSSSRQVENQAYVLTMGVDKSDNGLLLTVQVPKISSSGEQESSAAGGSKGNYFKFSAHGMDFESAIEKLSWVVPRNLNLSHLKLLVLSENLASNAACRDILYDIVHTERLFSAARVAVCEGKAADFIDQTKPVVGSRLSTDILSTFDHYIGKGFVPDCNLDELYYTTESVYSDPMTAYAVFTPSSEAVAAMSPGSISALAEDTSSEISTHYLGAAVFSEGVLKGLFDPSQTICANLLRGSLRMFRYSHDGQGLEIFPNGKPSFDINLQTRPIQISANIKLAISAQEDLPDLEGLKPRLEKEILSVIAHAQRMGAEPFGIAETAAGQFYTLDQWIDFNWKEKFSKAQVNAEVTLKRTGA